ncbi:VOC family protein [Homoserinibacter gongjuensis]|jgi:predicted enzyme related to lactoylglutathione lyase|uniref:Lyase n=1 Tax=Homoserinibacter gongjuensis TaxID=1162968 RepID=A0ABQ6JSN2_9MICO|nr:VOC family protein [Homoserinibacter gongjuensis]GMA91317.1 lyase [Homoserinibacter gongjuensis]
MTIRIQHSYIAFDDADAALTFYRDVVGFEVSNDVDMGGGMRWITLNPAGQDVSIVLTPVGAGESDADREVMADLLAKGVLGGIVLATDDLDADFERIAASGADIMQEPMDQPWGVRDAAFRDPAGNQLRLTQH